MELNKQAPRDWRRDLLIGLVLFGLIFFRYCYYGFEYYYQLDDYIQYHNYTSYNTDLKALMDKLGLLSCRPLAGLADLYVWSGLFDHMIWAVAAVSALYAASAVLLHSVFSRRFGTGMLFYVAFALAPFAFEGVYWLSASSRVVVGMFFASLSAWFFDSWCSKGGVGRLAAFAAFQLMSFCFYEQAFLLSAALTFVLMLLCLEEKQKRGLWGILMFASAGLYFFITSLAPKGFYGQRMELFLPWQEDWTGSVALSAANQIYSGLKGSFWGLCGKGLIKGFRILFTEPNILWMICAVLLCAALFLLARTDERGEKPRYTWELLCGLFLTAAPLAIFFLISPWIGLRNLVTSLCGLALICDALFDLLFSRVKSKRLVQAVVVTVLALMCSVASISEIKDYRTTYLADTAVAKSVADTAGPGGTGYILNVNDSYIPDCCFNFHEHGNGVTSSDWALSGAVQRYTGLAEGGVTPVSNWETVSADLETAGTAPLYFYQDGKCWPVRREAVSETEWCLITDAGEKGILRWQDGYMLFELWT